MKFLHASSLSSIGRTLDLARASQLLATGSNCSLPTVRWLPTNGRPPHVPRRPLLLGGNCLRERCLSPFASNVDRLRAWTTGNLFPPVHIERQQRVGSVGQKVHRQMTPQFVSYSVDCLRIIARHREKCELSAFSGGREVASSNSSGHFQPSEGGLRVQCVPSQSHHMRRLLNCWIDEFASDVEMIERAQEKSRLIFLQC